MRTFGGNGLGDIFARHWWIFIVRGIIAILFGIVAWLWPGLTLTTMIWLAGLWLIVDGVLTIIGAVINRDSFQSIWPLVLIGLAGIGFGIFIVAFPGFTAIWLIVAIGLYAIVTGVFAIISAIRLRKEIENEWSMGALGLISILFGLAMVVFPGSGALALIWVIAIYAILIGIAEVIFGFRVRGKGTDS